MANGSGLRLADLLPYLVPVGVGLAAAAHPAAARGLGAAAHTFSAFAGHRERQRKLEREQRLSDVLGRALETEAVPAQPAGLQWGEEEGAGVQAITPAQPAKRLRDVMGPAQAAVIEGARAVDPEAGLKIFSETVKPEHFTLGRGERRLRQGLSGKPEVVAEGAPREESPADWIETTIETATGPQRILFNKLTGKRVPIGMPTETGTIIKRQGAQGPENVMVGTTTGRDIRSLGPAYEAEQPSAVRGLSGQFIQQSRMSAEVFDAYARIQAAAQTHTPASDASLIFGFYKMIDPGSVVRESEFATARGLTGFPGRLQQLYQQAQSGELLTPTMRQDIINQARGLAQAQLGRYEQLESEYRRIGAAQGFDPGQVVPDLLGPLRGQLRTTEGAAAPGPGPQPTAPPGAATPAPSSGMQKLELARPIVQRYRAGELSRAQARRALVHYAGFRVDEADGFLDGLGEREE